MDSYSVETVNLFSDRPIEIIENEMEDAPHITRNISPYFASSPVKTNSCRQSLSNLQLVEQSKTSANNKENAAVMVYNNYDYNP